MSASRRMSSGGRTTASFIARLSSSQTTTILSPAEVELWWAMEMEKGRELSHKIKIIARIANNKRKVNNKQKIRFDVFYDCFELILHKL